MTTSEAVGAVVKQLDTFVHATVILAHALVAGGAHRPPRALES